MSAKLLSPALHELQPHSTGSGKRTPHAFQETWWKPFSFLVHTWTGSSHPALLSQSQAQGTDLLNSKACNRRVGSLLYQEQPKGLHGQKLLVWLTQQHVVALWNYAQEMSRECLVCTATRFISTKRFIKNPDRSLRSVLVIESCRCVAQTQKLSSISICILVLCCPQASDNHQAVEAASRITTEEWHTRKLSNGVPVLMTVQAGCIKMWSTTVSTAIW